MEDTFWRKRRIEKELYGLFVEMAGTEHRGDIIMQKEGFTLIELLVVIAIISLLVSILLPSLRKAKELAMTVQCLSQQKNMGFANFMYANESGGFSVPSGQWSASRCWLGNQDFLKTLGFDAYYSNHYIGNWSHWFWPKTALCPASNASSFPHPTQEGYHMAVASWGLNSYGLYPNYYYRISEVEKSSGGGILSNKVFLLDHISIEAHPGTTNPGRYEVHGEFNRSDDLADGVKRVAYRHHGRSNVLFHDGHAESCTPELLYNNDSPDTKETLWRLR